MGSHRRFISSGSTDEPYMLPLQSYGGFLNVWDSLTGGSLSRTPGAITTNLREEQKAPSLTGWFDYLFGGAEKEDIAASPTVGGIDIRTGKPFDPSAAYTVAEQLNAQRGGEGGENRRLSCTAYPDWVPTWLKEDVLGCARPKPDPRKVALIASAVVAVGVLAYAYPKIKARYAAPKTAKKK